MRSITTDNNIRDAKASKITLLLWIYLSCKYLCSFQAAIVNGIRSVYGYLLMQVAQCLMKQFILIMELTIKPGSVMDSHSSRLTLTCWLKQPTRVQYGPYSVEPLFGLAPGGVYRAANCYQQRGALLPHHFTLT
ncbi:MAG: hypothetical protein CMIDDMOC_00878 [Sodalis sp. Fle]|nr:MAG: hypothetical protein CMIDDMOC_00878 [Sodalis sp. Fle]